MGLKFLRDGVDSANVLSAVSLNGTPDEWNFFKHATTNHIRGDRTAEVKAIHGIISQVTDFTQDVGLSDFAKFDQKGTKETPIFPFELIFEPHSDVSSLFKDTKPTHPLNYLEQLKSIKPGSNLYNIYGLDAPIQLGGKKILIGTLTLDDKMVTSKFGDEALFFRHQRMSADLALKPDWKAYLPYSSLGGKCPYELVLKKLKLY